MRPSPARPGTVFSSRPVRSRRLWLCWIGKLSGCVGLAHTVCHPSTTRLRDVCYLQDLFTSTSARGQGVGRALIERVYAEAQAVGCSRVYWTTFEDNQTARRLYDRVTHHNGAIMYAKAL